MQYRCRDCTFKPQLEKEAGEHHNNTKHQVEYLSPSGQWLYAFAD
jgi:hypothetical protein